MPNRLGLVDFSAEPVGGFCPSISPMGKVKFLGKRFEEIQIIRLKHCKG